MVAIALAALAAGLAIADAVRPESGTVLVAVAEREVSAGHAMTEADVGTRAIDEAHVPDGVVRDGSELVGKLAAGPIGRGEVLTANRFAGVALAESLTGIEGTHVVAVTPRDAGLTPMLRTGDVVEVLAPGQEAGSARPVAHGARVVATDEDGVVLLALPPGAAATVASASLELPLTLVLSR